MLKILEYCNQENSVIVYKNKWTSCREYSLDWQTITDEFDSCATIKQSLVNKRKGISRDVIVSQTIVREFTGYRKLLALCHSLV